VNRTTQKSRSLLPESPVCRIAGTPRYPFGERGGVTKKSMKSERGFTLVETLVSVAILGAIGVALIGGLSTAYSSLAVSQERTFAESLAKSQVEYIKSQTYISVLNYDSDDPAKRYDVIDIPADLTSAGYTVEISTPEYAISNGENMTAGRAGFELQSITVNVKRYGSQKLTITFYRVGLALG